MFRVMFSSEYYGWKVIACLYIRKNTNNQIQQMKVEIAEQIFIPL